MFPIAKILEYLAVEKTTLTDVAASVHVSTLRRDRWIARGKTKAQ